LFIYIIGNNDDDDADIVGRW